MRTLLLASYVLTGGSLQAETISFEGLKPLIFKKIPETEYKTSKHLLESKVDASASALILAFDKPRALNRLSWKFQCLGTLQIPNAKFEESKKGDDSCLRIGLLISGPAPSIPFFAPSWIKALRGMMKLPSDKMVYLVSESKHSELSEWESPYSASIKHIVVPSKPLLDEQPWREADFSPKNILSVVGLWFMSDGDDTKSKFEAKLRDLNWQ